MGCSVDGLDTIGNFIRILVHPAKDVKTKHLSLPANNHPPKRIILSRATSDQPRVGGFFEAPCQGVICQSLRKTTQKPFGASTKGAAAVLEKCCFLPPLRGWMRVVPIPGAYALAIGAAPLKLKAIFVPNTFGPVLFSSPWLPVGPSIPTRYNGRGTSTRPTDGLPHAVDGCFSEIRIVPASSPSKTPAASAPVGARRDLGAGFLSFLIPGVGQIVQGRVGKGVLFLISIHVLFFYGMFLGNWKNVYLADAAEGNFSQKLERLPSNLYSRPQYVGQFWIGIAAWPALFHYFNLDLPGTRNFQVPTDLNELNQLQQDGDKRWDLGWIYTVIAGALNVLVIYDAIAGPAFVETTRANSLPAEGASK